MSENLIHRILDDLKEYEKTIDDIEGNLDKLDCYGRYNPCDVIRLRYESLFILNHLATKKIDISSQQKEYERIENKYLYFKKKWGLVFSDKLYMELKKNVESYFRTICKFIDIDETDYDLFIRDEIEYLFKELIDDYDIHDMAIKVSALDEALKCLFSFYIDQLLKELPGIEESYFPENFWWRHPSEFKNQ